jgi:succinate dehydrogenase/fumarate reductase flavoprotein subunit
MVQSEKAATRPAGEPKAAYSNGPVDPGFEQVIGQIQDLMWNDVGVVRTRAGLQKAVKTLEELTPKVAHP